MDLPVKFEALARAANTPVSGAYPYSLKGRDLDQNFNAVAIDIDSSWVNSEDNGQRTLLLPAVPTTGTYVLGAVEGALAWIATEEC
jgi:hypothetical protein